MVLSEPKWIQSGSNVEFMRHGSPLMFPLSINLKLIMQESRRLAIPIAGDGRAPRISVRNMVISKIVVELTMLTNSIYTDRDHIRTCNVITVLGCVVVQL